jgi:hypothetical protein
MTTAPPGRITQFFKRLGPGLVRIRIDTLTGMASSSIIALGIIGTGLMAVATLIFFAFNVGG